MQTTLKHKNQVTDSHLAVLVGYKLLNLVSIKVEYESIYIPFKVILQPQPLSQLYSLVYYFGVCQYIYMVLIFYMTSNRYSFNFL